VKTIRVNTCVPAKAYIINRNTLIRSLHGRWMPPPKTHITSPELK
jgi:hypothetical protein